MGIFVLQVVLIVIGIAAGLYLRYIIADGRCPSYLTTIFLIALATSALVNLVILGVVGYPAV